MHTRRLIAIIITIVLAAEAAAPFCVFAEEKEQAERSYKTSGQYYYNISHGVDGKTPDDFVFDEECFRESSFKVCPHIALLTSQIAKASTPCRGESGYNEDFSHASKFIEGLMSAMGFQNVAVNKYYNMSGLENSIGVAIGSRDLKVLDKDYTLIVLAPRSDGYNQEWCGNFMVGDGDIHQGFKEIRDEALRFLKKYINDNKINGNIKIWIAGHSRGGAVGNMVGGFLAGGGAEYLGSNVSLSPEDIYCNTTGTPSSIKDGTSKAEELSVSGPRGGIYENDTEGEPFLYCGTGNLDLTDPVYQGIRCYSEGYDVISFFPPKKWGFKYYGRICPVNGSGDTYGEAGKQVQEEDIIPYIERLSSVAYNTYIENRKGDFQWMTLDLSKMKMVNTTGPEGVTMEDFLERRISGLIANIPTNKDYVKGGYQDAMIALVGSVGMLEDMFRIDGIGLELTDPDNISLIVRLFSAYMDERKTAEKAAGGGPGGVDPTIVNEPVNEALRKKLNSVFVPASWKARTIYGKTFFEHLSKHIEDLNNYSNQIRQIVTYTLFYTEGEKYSQASALRSAMTLINNLTIYTIPHYCEIYLAWAKLVNKSCSFEHHTGQAEYDEEQEKREREHEKENRKQQRFTVTVKGGTVTQARVKKKAVTAAEIKVKKSYGKLTFSKVSGSKKLTVNSKGKITLKRGARKGKYKIKVRITAAGNSQYKAAAKNVIAVIRVK